MSCEGVNRHQSPPQVRFEGPQFSLATQRIQDEALASGIKNAETQALKGVKWVNSTTDRVCEKAYAEFERTMREIFTFSVSESLLELTLQSRRTLFFGVLSPDKESLRQRVKKNLEKADLSLP